MATKDKKVKADSKSKKEKKVAAPKVDKKAAKAPAPAPVPISSKEILKNAKKTAKKVYRLLYLYKSATYIRYRPYLGGELRRVARGIFRRGD